MHFIYKECFFLSADLGISGPWHQREKWTPGRLSCLPQVGIAVQEGQCVVSKTVNLHFGPLLQLPLVEMGRNWMADYSNDPTPETEQKPSSLCGWSGFGLMIVAVGRNFLKGGFTWWLAGGWTGAAGPSSMCLLPDGSGDMGIFTEVCFWEVNIWSKVTFVSLETAATLAIKSRGFFMPHHLNTINVSFPGQF